MSHKLKTGGSVIALITAMSFFATAVAAQTAAPAPQEEQAELEAVVVTGSSIRGVAPIGSNLVSVGQEAIEKTAATNASQLVNTVPAITTAGSAPQGENSYSYYSPQIHSLAGSGSNTTLVIIDGLRIPGGGTQYAQTDPNIIPTSAIQRVEVLADGASSVYGSDAVAGVVNFITRRDFDGTQISAKRGWGNHYQVNDINGIWGTTWDTGGVYVAAQYSEQSPVLNRHRDFLSQGDYRSVGGTNTNNYNCNPATIRTPQSGNNVYLSPTDATTVVNNADNGVCSTSKYGAAIQGARRDNVMVRVHNTFNDKLTVTGTFNYNHLQTARPLEPGTVSNITAFGPGSGKAGQINPFYVAPAGQPGATQETISWVALNADDDYGVQRSENDTFYLTAVAEYEITDDWSIKLSNASGRSRSSAITRDAFCSTCATLAINGTGQSSGSTTASDVPGENIISLNSPLTAANSLDVWRPYASGGTSAAVLRRIYSNNTSTEHYNSFNQTKLETQGKLFKLPAGDVRMAVGGEYMWSNQNVEGTNPNNTSNTNTGAAYRLFTLHREVYSGYAELVVPVVSPSMNVPLVRSFDLNLSGRYDHYSDVGATSNPKIAANWEPIEGIRFRGNYATAFVAPPLLALGDPDQGYMRNASGAGVSPQILVPVANFPDVKLLPGCATATVTCQIGLATNQGLDRSYGVGPDGKPQKGNSWSVGVDLNPTFLRGFTGNVTFWSNKFRGGVTAPSAGQVLTSVGLKDGFTLCPTGCSQAQIDAFTNVNNGASVSGSIPPIVYFLMQRDSGNILNLNVQGIDASFAYRYETENLGAFTIGGSLSYFTKYDQDFGDEVFSVLNTSGYNITFPNIQTKARGQIGWERGGLAVDAFLNYTGSYKNWSNTSVIPVQLSPSGNPLGGGDKVKADKTVDLHISYSFNGDFMPGSQVYVDVNNLFDKEPPFYNGNISGIGVGGWGYNGFTSNPIGRIISLGAKAKF